MDSNQTSAVVVIGNEILSGRTQDVNVQFLARRLGALGLPLVEVRVIPDVFATIVATINDVRARFDFVFTTGGIGPTHDDITSEAVAAAFGVPWEPHPLAWERLERHLGPENFNKARQRMATMPRGARLIENAISVAPGFAIGNVYVMAGVPRIMRSMFDHLEPQLPSGQPVLARAVYAVGVMEGIIAEGLEAIQHRFPDLDIGSYPFYRITGNGVALVAKGTDEARLAAAQTEMGELIKSVGRTPVEGEPEQ